MFANLIRALSTVTGSRLGRNASAMAVGQGGRVVLQGAYFVVLARALGVDGFGAFSGLVALVALVAPFGSLGAINLMIRNIVRAPSSAAVELATAVSVTAAAGLVMTGLICAVAHAVAPASVSLWAVLAIALAELVGARLVEVAGGVYSAHERMFLTAGLQLGLNALRLAAAGLLLLTPDGFSLDRWATAYLLASVAGTAAALIYVRHDVGLGRPALRRFRGDVREGILFSFSLASQTVYNDIDKAMLARLSTLEATGVYTAAYRVVDVAFTPMRALLAAAYPRFFSHGGKGLRSALRFTRRLAGPGLGYSMAASATLFLGAGLVPVVLGSDYQQSVGALRGLAVLPVLKACHYLASDSLTGAGHQGMRSLVQVAVAVANVALNVALIPAHGYRGAVVASVVSDGLLAILMWTVVGVVLRRTRGQAAAAATSPP